MDWSEQRHHLAGALGAALLTRLTDLGWVRRAAASRAVHVTGEGRTGLAVTRAGWVAKRLDNGRALVAATAGELRELIVADYAAQPVLRECAES